MANDDLSERYREEFDASAYPEMVKKLDFLFIFYQRQLHDIFSSDVVSGGKLVEFGCGPTPFSVFPATKKFQDVVLCEFLAQNREAVEKWIKKDPDALDWSFIAEKTAALEGYSDAKNGAEEIEERTRRAIKHVLPGDAFDLTSIPEQYRTGYDVLLTSLCLEAAATDLDAYDTAVRNVGHLVKPAGTFVQCGVLGCKSYTVGTVKFEAMFLTEEIVKDALKNAGFEVKSWSCDDPKEVDDYDYEYSGAFVVSAKKL